MGQFYTFRQNNSGGAFITDLDRGISEYVIIEAASPDDAIQRAEHIGLYFYGVESGDDCPCCGDRWSIYSSNTGTDEPMIYDQPLTKLPKEVGGIVSIHYIDGKIDVKELVL